MTSPYDPTRVVLLGSSAPAVKVLDALRAVGVNVVGIGTHASESQDFVGTSLSLYAPRIGIPVEKFGQGKRGEIQEFIQGRCPTVGLTVGFRYILDVETIRSSTLGWLNVHSSLLPDYAGRAPLNWAILNGETELGITLHYIDENVDTGDIVFQERFYLSEDEDIANALEKCFPLYDKLVRRLVEGLKNNNLPRIPQGENRTRYWPRRTLEDGEIDWNVNAVTVLRLIRAVAPPYPGAFTYLHGKRLFINKARRMDNSIANAKPGKVLPNGNICCAIGTIEPMDFVWQEDDGTLIEMRHISSYAGAECIRSSKPTIV